MPRLSALAWTLLFLAGCQPSSGPPTEPPIMTKIDLNTINLAYVGYSTGYIKPPRNLEELRPYLVATEFPESHRQMELDCLRSIQEGRYIVLWNQLGVAQVKAGEAKELLLAYEATAKTSGGWGVFGDNRIEWLKPEDLARLTSPANEP